MVTIRIEIAGATGTVDVDLSTPLGTVMAQSIETARAIADAPGAIVGIDEIIFRYQVFGGTAPASWVGLCWVVRAFAGFKRWFLVSCFPFVGSSGPPFGVRGLCSLWALRF